MNSTSRELIKILPEKKVNIVNKSSIYIFIYWIFFRLSDKLLANEADVNSAFSESANHYYIALSYTGVTALILMWQHVIRSRMKANGFLYIQVALYLYFILTSFWSVMFLISLGQAVYSFYGLIFAYSLARYCFSGMAGSNPLRHLVDIWASLIFIEYVISFVYFMIMKGFYFPPIDERALVSFVILMMYLNFNSKSRGFVKLTLFYIFFMGQSLSALIASVFPISALIRNKFGTFFSIIFFTVGLSFGFYLIELIQSGRFTIYGKDWSFMITGSGRFNVWYSLYEEIMASEWYNLIFGHGYMSERAYLVTQNLTWGIDAHSNILQSLYGIGILGTVIMLSVWFYPVLNRKYIIQVLGSKNTNILMYCHFSFIFFGLTSSHYFSRPSISATFMASIFFVIFHLGRELGNPSRWQGKAPRLLRQDARFV